MVGRQVARHTNSAIRVVTLARQHRAQRATRAVATRRRAGASQVVAVQVRQRARARRVRHFPHRNHLPARAVVGLGDELGGRDDFDGTGVGGGGYGFLKASPE